MNNCDKYMDDLSQWIHCYLEHLNATVPETPCPFCKSEEVYVIGFSTEDEEEIIAYAGECQECGALGPLSKTQEEAKQKYDSRHE